MGLNNRSILGPVNPYDDGVQANRVDGRQPTSSGPTDQASQDTQAERDAQVAAFREAQAFTSKIADDNTAGGVQLGRGPDTFTTTPRKA